MIGLLVTCDDIRKVGRDNNYPTFSWLLLDLDGNFSPTPGLLPLTTIGFSIHFLYSGKSTVCSQGEAIGNEKKKKKKIRK